MDTQASSQEALVASFHRHAQLRYELDSVPATGDGGTIAVALARLAAHVAALPASDGRIAALSRSVRPAEGRFLAGPHVAEVLSDLVDPAPCADVLLARFTAACLADAAPG